MVKTRSWSLSEPSAEERYQEYYTIKGNNKLIRVKDSVLIKPSGKNKDPYVARVKTFAPDDEGNVTATVRWFYRPEDTLGGRRQFHGNKELFLTDISETVDADTIIDKCTIHNYEGYTSLDAIRPTDYFTRLEYKHATGLFSPDVVMVLQMQHAK